MSKGFRNKLRLTLHLHNSTTAGLSAGYTHSSPSTMYLVIFQFLGAWKISCWLFSTSQNVLLLFPPYFFLIVVLCTHFHSTNLLSLFLSQNSVSIIRFPSFSSSSVRPLWPSPLCASLCLILLVCHSSPGVLSSLTAPPRKLLLSCFYIQPERKQDRFSSHSLAITVFVKLYSLTCLTFTPCSFWPTCLQVPMHLPSSLLPPAFK